LGNIISAKYERRYSSAVFFGNVSWVLLPRQHDPTVSFGNGSSADPFDRMFGQLRLWHTASAIISGDNSLPMTFGNIALPVSFQQYVFAKNYEAISCSKVLPSAFADEFCRTRACRSMKIAVRSFPNCIRQEIDERFCTLNLSMMVLSKVLPTPVVS